MGAFLIEHFVSNAFATRGPGAYTKQVELLSSFPFVFYLELFGIWLPILYHALYGFYIWFRGESNVADYPWTGNWMYTAQRWTGAHRLLLHRLAHLASALYRHRSHPEPSQDASFGKVQLEVFQCHVGNRFLCAWGSSAASWHFAYGLWLFAAKWGIASG